MHKIATIIKLFSFLYNTLTCMFSFQKGGTETRRTVDVPIKELKFLLLFPGILSIFPFFGGP